MEFESWLLPFLVLRQTRAQAVAVPKGPHISMPEGRRDKQMHRRDLEWEVVVQAMKRSLAVLLLALSGTAWAHYSYKAVTKNLDAVEVAQSIDGNRVYVVIEKTTTILTKPEAAELGRALLEAAGEPEKKCESCPTCLNRFRCDLPDCILIGPNSGTLQLDNYFNNLGTQNNGVKP